MKEKIENLIKEQRLAIEETHEQLSELTSLLDVKNKLSVKERTELENTVNELAQELSLRQGFKSDLETLL